MCLALYLQLQAITTRYQTNVVVALFRSRNGKGAMVLDGKAFVTHQNDLWRTLFLLKIAQVARS
ncbi:hypothetical protein CXP54_00325 [Escherichia albertii]|nr:hypothetical protein CXP54_00325 [Escherichia albertii]EAB1452575.1 hypothetical protein [Escherichia albertii]EEW3326743.1 hypothetical protein [Escherichia albertii]EEW7342495.1 hypothetical protein [Escherichia albertii]EFO1263021.1 hypothetical protein [Escherichia albertii]